MNNLKLELTPEYEFLQGLGLFEHDTFQIDNLSISYCREAHNSQDEKKPIIPEINEEYLNCFDVKKVIQKVFYAALISGTVLVTGVINAVSPTTGIIMTTISSFLFRLIDMNPRSRVTHDCALFYSYLVAYKHTFIDEANIVKEFQKFKLLAKKRYPNVKIRTKDGSIVDKLLKFNMIYSKKSKFYLNKYLKFSKNSGDFDFSTKQ